MSKENNLFVLLFSRENSVFHTNQPTLSINLFCCGEYSEIERRKIAQNKFHASACEIFNVTVLTQLTAIALAAQFETALFLKTTKTLSQLVPLEQASPHSKDNGPRSFSKDIASSYNRLANNHRHHHHHHNHQHLAHVFHSPSKKKREKTIVSF